MIEDTFFITGRGLVLVPGIVPQGDKRFQIGDSIRVIRPDGSQLACTIGGIEMISCSPPRPKTDVVILLKGLGKEDVPIGSELWSSDA
ncbi:hypothetical protein BH10PLA2_BH10PLA2_02900 [soil metagenome]